jgi:uncharacterized membrane protein
MAVYSIMRMRKHSHITDKQLAFELKNAKRLIAENLREAKKLHRYAKEIAEENHRRAKATLGTA